MSPTEMWLVFGLSMTAGAAIADKYPMRVEGKISVKNVFSQLWVGLVVCSIFFGLGRLTERLLN